MIGKIKEHLAVKDKLVDINAKLEAQIKLLEAQSKHADGSMQEINALRKEAQEYITYMKQGLAEIKQIKDELKEEVYDFRLTKSHVQDKILERFESSLSRELSLNTDSLKKGLMEYGKLKDQMQSAADELTDLKKKIVLFQEISKEIKKQDFELSRHKQNLDAAQDEKMTLLRKIDSLERLVARMRRRNV